jgi:hypothetical protein
MDAGFRRHDDKKRSLEFHVQQPFPVSDLRGAAIGDEINAGGIAALVGCREQDRRAQLRAKDRIAALVADLPLLRR